MYHKFRAIPCFIKINKNPFVKKKLKKIHRIHSFKFFFNWLFFCMFAIFFYFFSKSFPSLFEYFLWNSRIRFKPFFISMTDNVRLGYTEGVEGQSIVKLIVARLLRKLGNSIYRRSGDGQTVAARGQTSKGSLILHVGPKGFQFCLFNYMMMHNNQ